MKYLDEQRVNNLHRCRWLPSEGRGIQGGYPISIACESGGQ